MVLIYKAIVYLFVTQSPCKGQLLQKDTRRRVSSPTFYSTHLAERPNARICLPLVRILLFWMLERDKGHHMRRVFLAATPALLVATIAVLSGCAISYQFAVGGPK